MKFILANIASFFIRFVDFTSSKKIIGDENLKKHLKKDNVIFAFWHGRILMLPLYISRLATAYTISSRHDDGQIVADIVEKFGSKIIRGSTKDGAVFALKKSIKILKEGNNFCIAPDGPRGPNMKINGALIDIARITGKAIIPVSYSVKKRKISWKSWDKFIIPLPFNKIIVEFGKPIFVPSKISNEEKIKYLNMVEKNLNLMAWSHDNIFSQLRIVPSKNAKKSYKDKTL